MLLMHRYGKPSAFLLKFPGQSAGYWFPDSGPGTTGILILNYSVELEWHFDIDNAHWNDIEWFKNVEFDIKCLSWHWTTNWVWHWIVDWFTLNAMIDVELWVKLNAMIDIELWVKLSLNAMIDTELNLHWMSWLTLNCGLNCH